jgi:hypothetical protein
LTKRRIQAHGIHLRRLVYLSKEEFKFLKLLRFNFLKKARRFFEKQPRTKFLTKKQPLGCPTNRDFLPRIDNNHISYYEPTNIVNTRDSLFWSWRRVKEFYRDYLDIEQESKKKERQVYELMYR